MSNNEKKAISVLDGEAINGVSAGMLLAALLVLSLVVVSALGVIYSSFKTRQLFSHLQQQSKETVRLEEEWGRLLLEQSTWATHARIERLAKSKLNMVVPEPEAIIVVEQ